MSNPETRQQNLIAGTPLEAKVQEIKNLITGATTTRSVDRVFDNDFLLNRANPNCVKDIYTKREIDKIKNGGIKIPAFVQGVYKKYLDTTMSRNVTITLPCSGVSKKLIINIVDGQPYLGFSHMTSVYKTNVAKVDNKSGYVVVNIMPVIRSQGWHFFRSFMHTTKASRSIVNAGKIIPGEYAVTVHGFYSDGTTNYKERFIEAVNYCIKAPIESWDIFENEPPAAISGKAANPEIIVDDLLSNKTIQKVAVDKLIDLYDAGMTDAVFESRLQNFLEVEDQLAYTPQENDFAKETSNNVEIFLINLA